MPRPMTRARAERLGKGLNVIVLGLLRPSKRRLVLDSEVTDRLTDSTSISAPCAPENNNNQIDHNTRSPT
jgi:hypothetical protein